MLILLWRHLACRLFNRHEDIWFVDPDDKVKKLRCLHCLRTSPGFSHPVGLNLERQVKRTYGPRRRIY